MRLIEDGNFAGWLRVVFFLVGLALALAGLGLDQMPRWIRAGAFLVGFATMALGGISSRAHMLKIKPFDNSYRKARDSYNSNDGEDDKAK
ncbi:hypothetical protein [Burkholderia cenocepacia]|uniref:hypothetical protein n=1 Tax=Burkholderia cenocepacia TaxID=95486 RepID=UPI001CF13740|nr:hypothetical protein [Burkholderia cenocepacia]MCA7966997.1 hypothetical protein [Burkholderia cenocepacia]MDR8055751.1 hypothetical protein [Burkholderia cenocepacia]MDR8066191.1 hypothetical protein [Burkholderia cenocepacia]